MDQNNVENPDSQPEIFRFIVELPGTTRIGRLPRSMHVEFMYDNDDNGITVDDPLITELLPIFKDNKAEAERFVRYVDGEKRPTAITAKVNELIREEKIRRSLCKSTLWSILNRANIYTKSLQNWIRQVNA